MHENQGSKKVNSYLLPLRTSHNSHKFIHEYSIWIRIYLLHKPIARRAKVQLLVNRADFLFIALGLKGLSVPKRVVLRSLRAMFNSAQRRATFTGTWFTIAMIGLLINWKISRYKWIRSRKTKWDCEMQGHLRARIPVIAAGTLTRYQYLYFQSSHIYPFYYILVNSTLWICVLLTGFIQTTDRAIRRETFRSITAIVIYVSNLFIELRSIATIHYYYQLKLIVSTLIEEYRQKLAF